MSSPYERRTIEDLIALAWIGELSETELLGLLEMAEKAEKLSANERDGTSEGVPPATPR